MNDNAGGNSSGKKHRLRPWTRRLWIIAAGGILLALSPLAVALVGLVFNSQYLMTYHWVLYFSVPAGLPITVIAALAATVMTVRDFSKGREGPENGE